MSNFFVSSFAAATVLLIQQFIYYEKFRVCIAVAVVVDQLM
jgi:hypothetical protein